MKHRLGAAILAIGLLATTASAHPVGPFSDLVLFGDSLSDSGNAFILDALTDEDLIDNKDAYPAGQFTNGNVWATTLGLTPSLAGGTNFAVGGATAAGEEATDLAGQIALFRAAGLTLGPDPGAGIFMGSNDLGAAQSFADAAQIIGDAVTAIALGITTLFDGGQGITKFVLFGLPDLGEFPAAQLNPAITTEQATTATLAFNGALQSLAATPGALPEAVEVTYVDTFAALAPLFADPAAFGITNPAGTCVTDNLADPSVCQGDLGYLFQDPVHPTVTAHGLIADAFTDAVAPIPLPAGVILVLTGLGAFGAARLARRG